MMSLTWLLLLDMHTWLDWVHMTERLLSGKVASVVLVITVMSQCTVSTLQLLALLLMRACMMTKSCKAVMLQLAEKLLLPLLQKL